MKKTAIFVVIAMFAAVCFWGCSDDDESKPVTGTLTGIVIFHGAWPDSGTVQLSIFSEWNIESCSWCPDPAGGPPAYYTPATYFHDPDTTNGDGPDTMTYTISGISMGTYEAVAVGWRAPVVSNIQCDEPVIGFSGADPNTADSIPEPVTFSESQPTVTCNVHAYFNLAAVPGCNDRGRIEGVARISGDWPAQGLLVMITTFPVSGWNAVIGQPTGYYIMPTPADSMFYFVEPYGTYYLSIWTNAGPTSAQWYGSYGINTQIRTGHLSGTDAHPDELTLSANTPLHSGVVVEGFSPAPHWISGAITFNGTRPAEGLLVMVTTTPVSPLQPPTSAPWGYFRITDSNETSYAFTGMTEGTYYLSLWNNSQQNSVCYGAYGYTAGSDPDPDPVVLGTSQTDWGKNGINITAP